MFTSPEINLFFNKLTSQQRSLNHMDSSKELDVINPSFEEETS